MKNNTNFPKPKRGYVLDVGDKKAILKKKNELKTKLRNSNKLNIFNIKNYL